MVLRVVRVRVSSCCVLQLGPDCTDEGPTDRSRLGPANVVTRSYGAVIDSSAHFTANAAIAP